MPTEERQPAAGVIHHLFDEPVRHQFRQALRLLLMWLRSQGVAYDDAFKHVLRFQNSVSLGFPASEIAALKAEFVAEPTEEDEPATAVSKVPARIALTPAFIGLLGTNGTLPLHYSERIAAQQLHGKDESARAFLDILSNRMVGLFFEAWGKYRLESKIDTHGIDPLRAMLLQLGGFKGADRHQLRGEDDVQAYFAAAFRTRPTSAFAIAGALTEYFGVPIEIEQFVGCWDYLGASQLTVLGKAAPALGHGATLGKRIWRRDRRIRLNIGPLTKAGFDRCLPNGATAAAIKQMLKHFGVANLECEVCLILKPECIRPAVLSAKKQAVNRLGWDSFLTTENGSLTHAAVRYML
ncbi:MAG: type VI secretion system baseplate subunit TssG, partial [Pseudomonadota bacterium]|nr:type VI secretion system baseplate subunit TssG [Pseudomonadota bacterium]